MDACGCRGGRSGAGYSARLGWPAERYDQRQLLLGMAAELEHTPSAGCSLDDAEPEDVVAAAKTAMDHLAEQVLAGKPQDYYDRRSAMEANVGVGFKWQSPDGEREIVQAGEHPQTGEMCYSVATAGQRFPRLVRESELESELRRDRSNFESRTKQAHRSEAKSAAARERDSWRGFTDSMTPTAKARAIEVLGKQSSVLGELAARGDRVERLVSDGWRVGMTSEGRALVSPEGSWLREKDLTKLALDFAEFLVMQCSLKANPATQCWQLEYETESGMVWNINDGSTGQTLYHLEGKTWYDVETDEPITGSELAEVLAFVGCGGGHPHIKAHGTRLTDLPRRGMEANVHIDEPGPEDSPRNEEDAEKEKAKAYKEARSCGASVEDARAYAEETYRDVLYGHEDPMWLEANAKARPKAKRATGSRARYRAPALSPAAQQAEYGKRARDHVTVSLRTALGIWLNAARKHASAIRSQRDADIIDTMAGYVQWVSQWSSTASMSDLPDMLNNLVYQMETLTSQLTPGRQPVISAQDPEWARRPIYSPAEGEDEAYWMVYNADGATQEVRSALSELQGFFSGQHVSDPSDDSRYYNNPGRLPEPPPRPRRFGPPPPPPASYRPTPERLRSMVRREEADRFDPERTPHGAASPHHFAVNSDDWGEEE